MSTFADFLHERWRGRLAAHRVLTVYDPEGRYREVVASLKDEKTQVLFVGREILGARETALDGLRDLAQDPAAASGLVLYIQRTRPLDDAEWIDDPFAPVALAGAIFPDGPADEYRSLCLQFLPDRATEVDGLFVGGEPSFAVVNQLVDGAASYPTLSEVFQAEGPREILVRFLCLSDSQRKKLTKSKTWAPELQSLVLKTLGLRTDPDPKDPEESRHQLWRDVLFSEFTADLPGELPVALSSVRRASPRHNSFVYAVCDTLRDSKNAEQEYEDAASRVAEQLNLEHHCREIPDLGARDTFAFEERSFLRRFADFVGRGDPDGAVVIATARQRSFWMRDPRRAAEWKLAGCCLDFLRRVQEASVMVAADSSRTASAWIQLYASAFSPVDALYRQVEEVAEELTPIEPPLADLLAQVREKYAEAVDVLARAFQRAVVRDGWPAEGLLRAGEVFERFVHGPWQTGQRVVYFWVDALRYDLGLLLQGFAGNRHRIQLEPVCAQLPTFTLVGMAALLPGADTGLRLLKQGSELSVSVGGEGLENPGQRFQLIQRLVGADRCRMIDLEELVTMKSLAALKSVSLLVVKTTDIDQLGESNPAYVIRLIPEVVRKLQVAMNRLADAGYQRAVVTADHGFLWFAEPRAGDAVARPAGDWLELKDRCLLGDGQLSSGTLRLEARHAGIRGDIPYYSTPWGVATFQRGVRYCHEGLSPQECVLPLLTAELRPAPKPKAAGKADLRLSYRGEARGVVHILQPSIEVTYFGNDLFGPAELRFLLEAFSATDQRVGHAGASPHVNVETREVLLQRGQATKVPIRLQEGVAGILQVRASSAETGEVFATLTLETDFHH